MPQVAALQAIHDIGGLIGPLRVGAGKTLISFVAGSVVEADRVLLVIPAKLKKKTLREFDQLARHWRAPARLHVMSYELLSRDRGLAELKAFRPDLVIADEAHKFKSTTATCTKRMHRYLTKENPDAAYVDMSGTITKRSILEYYHRQNWAIPDGLQPLPRKYPEARQWADAIDEKTPQMGRLMPGALLQMCTPEEIQELGGDPRKATSTRIVRQAYCRRLMTAPGVVGTEEQFDGAMSLIIQGHEFEPGQAVVDAFQGLRDDWALPDGQPIDTPATLWRHARELSQGFYYTWWNQEGFNKCLWQIQKNVGNTIASGPQKENNRRQNIVLAILNECVPTIEKDTALAQVYVRLKSENLENSLGISKPGMVSLLQSTRHFSPNTMALATSANKKEDPDHRGVDVAEVVSQLTTITKQGKSGVCSAPLATERSECWEMILRALPELLPIFEKLFNAAQPPPEWLIARRAWAATVRGILKDYHDLDSPLMVARAIEQGRMPWAKEALEIWRAIRPTFDPKTRAEWIDTACLEWAAGWAKNNRGIVWVHEVAFGKRLSEETGLPYYGAKGQCLGKMLEDETGACIASIAANSEGRNLQHFSRNAIVSCPPGGAVWEQMLGRTHRDGQQADEVTADVPLICYEQWDVFRKARRDAEYIERTTAQAQKLNFADVTVQEEGEIEKRHALGDPLWCKDNAEFFESEATW
jgi:hypothetical protein